MLYQFSPQEHILCRGRPGPVLVSFSLSLSLSLSLWHTLLSAGILTAFPAVLPHAPAGSSSFESQKMERPVISILSPSSPGGLRDAPQTLPGQLSVRHSHHCMALADPDIYRSSQYTRVRQDRICFDVIWIRCTLLAYCLVISPCFWALK